ncbi:hypothetical protein [Marinobacter xestospongiae]|uniref:hypothetical protein n=1 Tax=Marinobacter xestospongiae TaxID=994319 RepID=UPI00200492EC|nr:hypothetical protein [Marinobacter xestospongiae]MCK7569183.1 hypothetical protein [Marinobacter xestospongiae]
MIRITDGFVGARNSLEEGDDGPPKFLDLQSTRLQCTVFGPAQRVFRKYSKNVNRIPLGLPEYWLISHPDSAFILKGLRNSPLNLDQLRPPDVLADLAKYYSLSVGQKARPQRPHVVVGILFHLTHFMQTNLGRISLSD